MSLSNIVKKFPKDFIFGTATSSYQIEGSSLGGCGESHWDSFSKMKNATHKFQNGSIACKHIENWNQDLDLIANAGFGAYRFSFSWPRILKDGRKEKNHQGISFYDQLIDGMLERDIKPFSTLYHWDLPQTLAAKGGWTNKDTCKWFADYTETVMKYFGDRLYSIATLNEPWCIAWLSHYLGHHAPGIRDLGSAVKCMHYILLAHGQSLSVLRDLGHKNVGIVLNKAYMTPASKSEKDLLACSLNDEIYNLWFDEAIFKGQYPTNSLKLFHDYMPRNFEEDLSVISKRLDWIGINYYTREIVKADLVEKNIGFKTIPGDLPKTDMGWEIFPDGLTRVLRRLIDEYSKSLPIHITENGIATRDHLNNGAVDDSERVNFLTLHLEKIKSLLDEKAPIKGYFAWSLLDNFEWSFGYEKRFGIVHVDFDTQKRVPKNSYFEFQNALNHHIKSP